MYIQIFLVNDETLGFDAISRFLYRSLGHDKVNKLNQY